MTTAQDLFAQGSHAFAEDDYEEALNLYSQAIEVNGTHVEIFLKRYFFFTSILHLQNCTAERHWSVLGSLHSSNPYAGFFFHACLFRLFFMSL